MAIRRCPYCKAIIDEGSEYCSNCGTQLIFPEDEFVEEEIPGEKIVDVDEEDIESQEEEQKRRRGRSTKGKKADAEPGEAVAEERPESVEAESAEEAEESEADAELESRAATEPGQEIFTAGEEDKEEIEEGSGAVDLPEAEEPPVEDEEPVEIQEVSPAEIPYEEPSEQEEEISLRTEEGPEEDLGKDADRDDSMEFKTADLEGMVDPAEKEKEEIEKFLDSLKEEREKAKKYYEETGELPPWAQSMRSDSASGIPYDTEEEMGEESLEDVEGEEDVEVEEAAGVEEPFGTDESEETGKPIGDASSEGKAEGKDTGRPADTGMGLPETVDQQNLPFSQGLFSSTIEKAKQRRFKKPEVQFSPWIKSRIFDVLLIFGIWIVTLWLASRVVEISLFQLLAASTVQTLGFLVILLLVYFFLFLFFLGETLGDHLFSEE